MDNLSKEEKQKQADTLEASRILQVVQVMLLLNRRNALVKKHLTSDKRETVKFNVHDA